MPKLSSSIFLAALFLIFLLPPTDPDLGWHLRCGELFWQERSFCEQNQFTVLLPNYSWPNHAWGYQALIYPIWTATGLWGLTVFNALLMMAAFGFLYAAVKNFRLEKMLAILLTVAFGWGVFSFGIRSQLIGFFFFNLTLYLLTHIKCVFGDETARPRLNTHWMCVLLPLTMLAWANTHGSVMLGLILIGFFISSATATQIKNHKFLTLLIPLALLAVSSAAATLVNPFGFRIYEEMWRHFAGPIDLSKLIAEWVPPNPPVWHIILLSGILLSVYLGLRQFLSALLILIFTYWTLQARRNVPFYFSLASFLFLMTPKTKDLLSLWRQDKTLRNTLAGLTISLTLAYGLLVRLPQTVEANRSWENYVQTSPVGPPMEAIEFLKNQEDRGHIFNRYEWGGFLIWQLPDRKIFVDGRMPAWPTPSGKSPYTIYLETLQTQPGWQEALAQYDINWILISPNTFMDLLLKPDPASFGWREVFRDKTSVIYKKL